VAIVALNAMTQEEAVPILETAAGQTENPYLRARALWQLGRRGRLRYVNAAMTDADPRFRTLAIRILKDFQGHTPDEYVPEWRKALLDDPSAAVRREALLAMRDVPPAKCGPFIVELAKRYEPGDRFYLGAVGIAVGADPKRREAILADFEKQFPKWNAKTADLVWELRPTSMLPTLGKKLADAKLTAAERARIVDILATSDDRAAGLALLGVLRDSVPAEVRLRAVENLRLFLPGKWQSLRQSDELRRTIDDLLKPAGDPAAGLALIAAAGRVGDVSRAAELAGDAKTPTAVRRTAVETLGELPSADAVAALVKLLRGGDKALSAAVVNALAQHLGGRGERPGGPQALRALQELVSGKEAATELRNAGLSALAGTRPGTVWLLELHGKGRLPQDLRAETARLLRNSPFQDLRNRAMVAFPPPGRLDPKKLPTVAELAARKGDAARGRQLLAASAKNDLQCLKCHTVRGAGGSIGPDLSMIGKKASRENLVESILLPSKAIADQFLTWNVETKKGLALSGLLVEETGDHVVLRDGNGKDTRVEKKDVESREKGPNSLMPNDLLVYMTADDVVDLTEYLLTLKTPMLAMDYWHIAGPFDNGPSDKGLDVDYGPEKGVDLKGTYKGKAGAVSWRTVKPDGQGYVDLQTFLGKDSANAMSYLWRAVESPADQDATILLGPDDGAKLFVNGAAVYTDRRHRAATPEADTVKVKLKKGRNEILLKIVNGDGPHGFYLTVAAEQELKRLVP
jgi:putative heme-binding domain-containing protein